MMPNVAENIFHGAGRTNYTLVFADSGPWINAGGRPCHLVSVDARGGARRTVEPATVVDGDREPVAHFGLSPSGEPRREERRLDPDRRQGERRAGARGADDGRQGDRRRPRRHVIRQAPN